MTTHTYLQFAYDSEARCFYKNGAIVPEEMVKEIPTYVRLVLRDMAKEPIPACFTPIKGGNA